MAAPAYLAVAGQAGEAHGRVVAPSTAHTLTAGVFGTRPPARARGVARWPAEARGVFQVDKVSSAKALAVAAGPASSVSPVATLVTLSTRTELSNLYFSSRPVSWKGDSCFQQVRTAQEPETP